MEAAMGQVLDLAAGADARTLEVLVKARRLISYPVMWGKGSDKNVSPDAKCLYLAIESDVDGEDSAMRALGFSGPSEVWTWNDDPERTHAEVLARLDEAIARLKAKH
jgi:hypothetical protein